MEKTSNQQSEDQISTYYRETEFSVEDPKAQAEDAQKTSSIETIFSLVNQMMGGTMLVLPILFYYNGLIGATINMTVTGIISCKTCMMYIEHLKPKEQDYNESIIRILGKNYELLYRISKGCYLVLLALTYFILITQQLYLVVIFIIAKATGAEGVNPYFVAVEENNQFVLDKFSIPYMTLVTLAFTLCVSFVKNIVIFIKISSYGSFTIIFFALFIIYIFFDNIFTDEFKAAVKHQRMFSWDIGALAGTAALAFALHVNSAATLKSNRNQENNKRDLIWVYIICGGLYIMIGLLGCLGVLGNCEQDEDAEILNDCFPTTDVANLIIVLLYLFNLLTSFPIYFGVMKGSFFNMFMVGKVPTKKQDTMFNVIYLLICAVVQNIPGLSPDQIMALNGSVCCFFFVYVIPIAMHMKCYHGSNKLMLLAKQSISKIGLIKKDEDQDKLLKEQREYRSRFISQKNPDGSAPLLAGDDNGDKETEGDDQDLDNDMYKQQKSQQRRYSVAAAEHERRRSSVHQLHQQQISGNVQKKDINTIDSEYPLDPRESEQDLEDELDRLSFESCNDHSEKEGTGKTVRVIAYIIVGLAGVFILLYELVIVFRTLFHI